MTLTFHTSTIVYKHLHEDLMTTPLFCPNFGGVSMWQDRWCWGSYSVVKLLSKYSNLCDVHGTWTEQMDGRNTVA